MVLTGANRAGGIVSVVLFTGVKFPAETTGMSERKHSQDGCYDLYSGNNMQ